MKSHWSHVSAPFRTLTFRFHRTSGKCSDRGLNPTKAQPHLHSSNHTSTGSSLCAGRLAGSGRCLEMLSACLCLHRGDQHQRAACPLTWPRWGPASSGSVHVAWCCLCASQGSPASAVTATEQDGRGQMEACLPSCCLRGLAVPSRFFSVAGRLAFGSDLSVPST